MNKNRRTKSTSMAEMLISPVIQQMLAKNINKKKRYSPYSQYSSKKKEEGKKVSININNNFNANNININILPKGNDISKKEPLRTTTDKFTYRQCLKSKKPSDQINTKCELISNSKPPVNFLYE